MAFWSVPKREQTPEALVNGSGQFRLFMGNCFPM
jgi:hypothetical protein